MEKRRNVMDRYDSVVASLCGGALVGEFIFPGGGCIAGGLLGIWVGWPKKEENGSDKQDQI